MTNTTSTSKEAHPIAKVIIQNHPYNVTVPPPKTKTIAGNHPQKMQLSQDPIFNVVAHCLDDS